MRERDSSAGSLTRLSPLFLCLMAGVAMTLLAWYGPWEWPALPAFTTIELVLGSHGNFAELSTQRRAAWVTALIALNSGFWGLVLRAVWWGGGRVRGSRFKVRRR